MKVIDDIKKIDVLINNYKNLLGKKTIICDVPLQSLKTISKILTYYKKDVLFLRRADKDIENLANIKKHLGRIERGQVFEGYKRVSKYIPIIKQVVAILETN